MKSSYQNYVILGPSKRALERRRRRKNVSFLQSIVMICEAPFPARRGPTAPSPHQSWLEANLPNFFRAIGQRRTELHRLITEHADKCYLFRERWDKEGIPFVHGLAIYLLSRTSPYDIQVTSDVETWVVDNYDVFKPHLPPPPTLGSAMPPPPASDW